MGINSKNRKMKFSFAFLISLLTLLAACSQSVKENNWIKNKGPRNIEGMDQKTMMGTGYKMMDGVMVIIKNGEVISAMDNDAILDDGTKIMRDGTIMQKGRTIKLRDGQSIWEDGTMLSAPKMEETDLSKGIGREQKAGRNTELQASFLPFTK